MTGTGPLRWFKSSYSDGGGGNCVEIATCPHSPHPTIHIRDSKNSDGPVLTVSVASWTAFLPLPHPHPET
ncbi:DUF397 domain-containing protein [Streptomyces sp. NPDC088350]|uniref:DUF397 domain-containing protein n=1 Tax=Streptomyces sp. NPDC088350 TaxID=3365854 RepID=UPI00382BE920